METIVQKYRHKTPNAFFLFNSEYRKRITNEYPGLTNPDISRLLGSLWKRLESDKRQEFIDRAKQIRAKSLSQLPKEIYWNSLTIRQKSEPLNTRKRSEQFFVFNHLIVWNSTLYQMSKPNESQYEMYGEESQTFNEEKRQYLRGLGLCQMSSNEYFYSEAKLTLNTLLYKFLALYQTVDDSKNRIKEKECLNKVKRPRGRPRKYWPNSKEINKV